MDAVELTRGGRLEVQAGGKDNVSSDEGLAGLDFFGEVSVANDSGGVSDFSAGFVESGDDADDGAFLDVGQGGDGGKVGALCPFVDDLD